MPLNRVRSREVMAGKGLDAIIATSPENVYYASDYWSLAQRSSSRVQAYAVIPADGNPFVVAPAWEADLALSGRVDGIYLYGQEEVELSGVAEAEGFEAFERLYSTALVGEDAISALTAALESEGLSRGVIALEPSGAEGGLHEGVRGVLPGVELIDGRGLLEEIRMVKTGEELERIRRATEVAERSMEDALEIARPGIMERDMASMFEYSAAGDGCEVYHRLIGFGERSSLPNPIPSQREAKRGDLIRMSLGCTWMHYNSNISRTAVLGRPPAEIRRAWEAVASAQSAILDEVRAGASLSQLYVAGERSLRGAGIRVIPSTLGHGIGVELEEEPRIGRADGELLEGMALNIDVRYLKLGRYGLEIEDTVMVTDRGFERLTRTEGELYIL
jgi:Xaa-Pro aminopeptidase